MLCAFAPAAPATPAGTNGQIVWQQESQDAPPQLWIANPDGSQAREVLPRRPPPASRAPSPR
jgi:hypothetical protein